MKTKCQIYTLVALLLFAFVGCKKDSASPSSNSSKTSIITSKSWRVTNLKVSLGSVVLLDQLQGMPTCELDNVIKFATAGTYSVEEGATKCDPSDPNIVDNGTWKLESNETKFNLDGELLDVVEISNNIIKLRTTVTENGITATLDMTLQP